jgi:hypothetical protein
VKAKMDREKFDFSEKVELLNVISADQFKSQKSASPLLWLAGLPGIAQFLIKIALVAN